jgi:hypothetical protein
MEDHTKRKLFEYYSELEKVARNPKHKAYASLMLYRLKKNVKLSFYKSSKPMYDPKRKKMYENIPHAAKSYGVSTATIKANFEQYGFIRIEI